MKDAAARDALIVDHLHVAEQEAKRKARGTPRHVALDDLRSSAYVGLVQAAERFTPERGVPFEAYARRRCRGAILDYLRGEDHAPARANARGLTRPALYPLEDQAGALEGLVDPAPTPEQACLEATRALEADFALDLVTSHIDSARYRRLVFLLRSHRTADVAALEGCSESLVYLAKAEARAVALRLGLALP